MNARTRPIGPKAEVQAHDIQDADRELYLSVCTKVVAGGFVPATDLRTEYGDAEFTKCIAMLFRTFRVLREVRRPWKNDKEALGYEWADRRFSKAEQKKLPAALNAVLETFKQPAKRYTDFEEIAVRCRWTNRVLGAMPVKRDGDDLNVFDRGADGSILIPAYCLRAMAAKGLPMIGKEAACARRIGWAAVRIADTKLLEIITRPIIDQDGQTGLGLKRSESLPADTEFLISAMVPTSVLREDEFLRLLKVCGQFVHLSPARSSGFGDFEVVEVQ